ncbi:MAG: NAD(P)/FAD-dependent oxidoreductase [Solirubrobacteraceae bacterium]
MADACPNYSICGIPHYVSGDVADWHNLAHRTIAEREATGLTLRHNTVVQRIEPEAHKLAPGRGDGPEQVLESDALVVAAGALPITHSIGGLDRLGPGDGVHLLQSMGDMFALMRTLRDHHSRRALIVGGGYVGLEMAEALVARGAAVTRSSRSRMLPTVGSELGVLVRAELQRHGVKVSCDTASTRSNVRNEDRSIACK